MTRLVLFCTIILVFASCDDHHPDTEKIIQELHNREPKRVTPGQIIALTQEFGREITDIAAAQMDPIMLTDSIKDFKLESVTYPDSLGKFEIRLISEKEQANKEEAELFSAYMFSPEHVSSDIDNVQDVKAEGYLLYNRPYMFHGNFIGMWSVKYKKGEIVRLYPNL